MKKNINTSSAHEQQSQGNILKIKINAKPMQNEWNFQNLNTDRINIGGDLGFQCCNSALHNCYCSCLYLNPGICTHIKTKQNQRLRERLSS